MFYYSDAWEERIGAAPGAGDGVGQGGGGGCARGRRAAEGRRGGLWGDDAGLLQGTAARSRVRRGVAGGACGLGGVGEAGAAAGGVSCPQPRGGRPPPPPPPPA